MKANDERLRDLAHRWLDEAERHRMAAEEIGLTADESGLAADESDDEERLLHEESARIYGRCAAELFAVAREFGAA